MNNPSGALDEVLRSFALAPDDPATQEEILRLSRVTGRWEEAIRVQGQLFALAEELPEKLTIARNAAHLVEHEVKDLVRAFRAYLNAFRLAPDDEEITGHLWRLAALIGRYDTFQAKQEAAAETQTDDELTVEVDDIEAEAETATAATRSADTPAPRSKPTGERPLAAPYSARACRRGDRRRRHHRGAGRRSAGGHLGRRCHGRRAAASRPLAPPPEVRAQPTEDQPYATPWEELADAYESLPAEDRATRRQYLLKIVEVWERGEHDIDRALDAIERAFRLDTSDAAVRADIERLGGAHDKWDRVA